MSSDQKESNDIVFTLLKQIQAAHERFAESLNKQTDVIDELKRQIGELHAEMLDNRQRRRKEAFEASLNKISQQPMHPKKA